jgi:glycosyltransferase involved in cell wall biosynthesis
MLFRYFRDHIFNSIYSIVIFDLAERIIALLFKLIIRFIQERTRRRRMCRFRTQAFLRPAIQLTSKEVSNSLTL